MDETEKFHIKMLIRETIQHPLSKEMIERNPEIYAKSPEYRKMVEEQIELERNFIQVMRSLLESA